MEGVIVFWQVFLAFNEWWLWVKLFHTNNNIQPRSSSWPHNKLLKEHFKKKGCQTQLLKGHSPHSCKTCSKPAPIHLPHCFQVILTGLKGIKLYSAGLWPTGAAFDTPALKTFLTQLQSNCDTKWDAIRAEMASFYLDPHAYTFMHSIRALISTVICGGV